MGVFGFPRENEFDELVWQYATAEGVDPLLVKAEMAQESNFDPAAYRPETGDASRGLMQVLYKTAVWLGYRGDPGDDAARVGGLYDPETSILYGAKYLAYQWGRYAGSATQRQDTVAAYNAGTVRRDAEGYYVNSRGERTVQLHVDRVMRFYEGYLAAYTQGGGPAPPGPDLELVPGPAGEGSETSPPAEETPPEAAPAVVLWILAAGVLGILLVSARRR